MAVSRFEFAFTQSDLKLPESGLITVFRANPDEDYSKLPKDRLKLCTTFLPHLTTLEASGFNVSEQPENGARVSIIQITRSKSETLGLIGLALEKSEQDGLVVVDGSKTDGIESILKRCKSAFSIEGTVSKSHGRLFWFSKPDNLPAIVREWATLLTPTRNSGGFLTTPGVFSPDKPDPGSVLLAGHFSSDLGGHVADLGAGWGWLSAQALKLGHIERIDLYEAEKAALDLAGENLQTDKAEYFWANVRELKTDRTYDNVICNPPFHNGRSADPSIGQDFIRSAAQILKPSGKLWLVANRQLPYETILQQVFVRSRCVEETNHFKIIIAEKPKTRALKVVRSNSSSNRRQNG